MLIFWSPHARSLFAEILQTIAHERSLEDAIRWRVKIGNVVSLLDRLPEMGSAIPPECFFNAPTDRTIYAKLPADRTASFTKSSLKKSTFSLSVIRECS